MQDDQLDRLLTDAEASYRVPPAPPIDAIWAKVEREAFAANRRDAIAVNEHDASLATHRDDVDSIAPDARTSNVVDIASRRMPAWRTIGMVAAASLTIGVLAGRLTVPRAVAPEMASAAPAAATPLAMTTPVVNRADPGDRLTEELLGRTALLLASLPRDASAKRGDPRLSEQAGRLLSTTRLLLDSPSAARPQMRALLQDLELVLVQVAQLRAPRASDDLTIIKEAVEERALVPRIRSAVADLAGGSE